MSKKAEAIEAMKKRVREAVILFEHREGSKLVDLRDVATLVRHMGVNPSGAQISLIVDQLTSLSGDSETTHIPMEHIETIVSNFLVTQESSLFRDDYVTLIRAFRAFDGEGKGYVMAEQLKIALATRGEPMTDDEMNKMLGYAADDNGRIYYEDYAQKLATDGRSI